MPSTRSGARADPEHRTGLRADGAPLLPPVACLDGCHRRSTLLALRPLPQALPVVGGTEFVPVQGRQPSPTRLSVEHRRPRGVGQPQPAGRDQASDAAGEQDLELLSGQDWRAGRGWLAHADGAAAHPHEGWASDRVTVAVDLPKAAGWPGPAWHLHPNCSTSCRPPPAGTGVATPLGHRGLPPMPQPCALIHSSVPSG
jgi:hypothetical protein